MPSRRTFLAALPASALAVTEAATGSVKADAEEQQHSASLPLTTGWHFTFSESGDQSTPVSVPHTWQSLAGKHESVGVGTYQLQLFAPHVWAHRFVRVEFEAATHTAHVALNNTPVGEHIGKGYTAFTCDLSPALHYGQQNMLSVQVDNRPSDRMLPRNDSYDWTNDGGLIRPVNLMITPQVFIERVEIEAVPGLSSGNGSLKMRALVRNTTSRACPVTLDARFFLEATATLAAAMPQVTQIIPAASTSLVELKTVLVEAPSLWHFDAPHLYTAEFSLRSQAGEHRYQETFGFRTFEVRGTAFFLNGEQVSLMGVERMAGSNPDFGMAETADWIRANHEDMKQLNCVYTRVHWAQDKRVLDYCDRNGILMQEEVPSWGAATFLNTGNGVQDALEQNGLEQLREMIARDRNHPCIVTWGLCNEVDGKNPRTRQFAHVISKEARRLDPSRLQTYASNTLRTDPGADMAGDFDFVSTNEYFGSWSPGGVPEVRNHIRQIRAAFPSKPIVVSEYGWCECQNSIMPGDENRADVVNSHTDVFRETPDVAGAIYFDYNDYRTLVGDKGTGAMRQRVHGVVDLYARRKPSFAALRRQSSPIQALLLTLAGQGLLKVELQIRKQLPGYTLRNYNARWVVYGYDDLPVAGGLISLPDLAPGSSHDMQASFSVEKPTRLTVDILRPTGFSITTGELLLGDSLN